MSERDPEPNQVWYTCDANGNPVEVIPSEFRSAPTDMEDWTDEDWDNWFDDYPDDEEFDS